MKRLQWLWLLPCVLLVGSMAFFIIRGAINERIQPPNTTKSTEQVAISGNDLTTEAAKPAETQTTAENTTTAEIVQVVDSSTSFTEPADLPTEEEVEEDWEEPSIIEDYIVTLAEDDVVEIH